MIQVVNILLGLWSVHQAWYATTLIQEFNIQVFAIMLFIFTEAVQGVLLIFAPAPKVKVRRPTNFVWVVLLLICVMEAGVNVVKSPLPHSPGFILILLGQILSFWAVISLGRMFGIFSEARGICTSGPYKYLKHPMYVGYAFTYIGLALQTDSPKAWYFYWQPY